MEREGVEGEEREDGRERRRRGGLEEREGKESGGGGEERGLSGGRRGGRGEREAEGQVQEERGRVEEKEEKEEKERWVGEERISKGWSWYQSPGNYTDLTSKLLSAQFENMWVRPCFLSGDLWKQTLRQGCMS